MTTSSRFPIPQIDCALEEQFVRDRLRSVPSVGRTECDVGVRRLPVTQASSQAIAILAILANLCLAHAFALPARISASSPYRSAESTPTPTPTAVIDDARLVGQIGGEAKRIAAVGNRVFVGVSQRVLLLDVSDPTEPRLLDQTGILAGVPNEFVVDHGRLFVASGGAGLLIYDLSVLDKLRLLGSVVLPNRDVNSVAVADGFAYLADGAVETIDLADVLHPVLVGTTTLPGLAAQVVAGRHQLYVLWEGNDRDGMSVLSIADPQAPHMGAELELRETDPHRATRMALVGNTMFIRDSRAGTQVVDLSNPSRPKKVAVKDWAGEPIRVFGARAFLVNNRSKGQDYLTLTILDLSEPLFPRVIGALADHSSHTSYNDVTAVGDLVFVTDDAVGVRVMNARDPANLVEVGHYSTGLVRRVATVGKLAFVSHQPPYRLGVAGLEVIDVQDACAPRRLAYLETSRPIADLAATDTTVILVEPSAELRSTLRVVDVSDPTAPVGMGTLAIDAVVNDVVASGDMAYVAAGDSGLLFVDVADREHPAVVGRYGGIRNATGVAVAGQVAYVVDETVGLHVIDLAVPSSPREPVLFDHFGEVGPLGYPPPGRDLLHAIVVDSGHAYLSAGDHGVIMVNVSDPFAPRLEGRITPTGDDMAYAKVLSMAASASRLHVVWDFRGPQRVIGYDVHDPRHPVRLYQSSAQFSGEISDLAFSGNNVLAANGEGGTWIIGTCATASTLTGTDARTSSTSSSKASATATPIPATMTPTSTSTPTPSPTPLALSTPVLPPEVRFDVVGAYGGKVDAVAEQHGKLLVGYADRLVVMDVQHDDRPVELGTLRLPSPEAAVRQIATDERWCFVLAGTAPVWDSRYQRSFIHVVDLSDAAQPTLKQTIAITGTVLQLLPFEGRLIASVGWSGRGNGWLVFGQDARGRWEEQGFRETYLLPIRAAIVGTLAYWWMLGTPTQSTQTQLLVVDLTDPLSPRPIGAVSFDLEEPNSDERLRFATSGQSNGFVFLCDTQTTVTIDARDPKRPVVWHGVNQADPTELPGLTGSGDQESYLKVVGNRLYFVQLGPFSVSEPTRLFVYDIGDGPPSKQLGSVDLGVNLEVAVTATSIAVIGSKLFIAGGAGGGLQEVEVSDPTNPTSVSTSGALGKVACLDSAAGRIVAVDMDSVLGFASVMVLQVRDGTYTELAKIAVELTKGDTPYPKSCNVALWGRRALITGSVDGMIVLDLADPHRPFVHTIGHVDGEWHDRDGAAAIAIYGRYAAIADPGAGFGVLDLRGSDEPRAIAVLDTPGQPIDVSVSDGLAFVAMGAAGVSAISLQVPTMPKGVGLFQPGSNVTHVASRGRTAYATMLSKVEDGLGSIVALYTNPPSQPVALDTWTIRTSYLSRPILFKKRLYVAAGETGIRVLDVRNPNHLREIGGLDLGQPITGLAHDGDTWYATTNSGGFVVLHVE